jgi:Xaa-Pro aminopeptidase
VVLGGYCAELQEQFEVAVKAQELAMRLCKPGARPMDIWEPYNAYLRSIKQPEERRLLLHGQGYDMVERPSVQPGETMKIKANMNIAAQATLQSEKAAAVICANYLVTDSGNVRLHQTPNKIFIV